MDCSCGQEAPGGPEPVDTETTYAVLGDDPDESAGVPAGGKPPASSSGKDVGT
jgi:hypothetical protein